MPLHKIEKINSTRFLALWHIDESYQDLFEAVKKETDEYTMLSTFRHEDKKKEWLAGRLTIMALCQKLNLTYHGVIKDEHGKPYLKNCDAEISLSHSYPYVSILLDLKTDVGIDLEQKKAKLIKVQHKFLTEEEAENANNAIEKLGVYWCAKEALYKICSSEKLSFKDNIRIAPFDLDTQGKLFGKIIVNGITKSYQLEYRVEENYILAFNID
ncbi:4'-phosphopantetheinyl transferase superfamily protein [Fulvivirga maritima]|uniref:4'-phosphopantetheinyl transferase superfamily protein n=1 Tax=Fulvivirga maritima TaxID=2904247 RepID=UPI001F43AA1D|nr:4'-phosphopantetheinyl transferase superfamily protein [Fulvivirga maritima]UII29263.1 4'-phosphopantetheinyl transferase superfamily protein [Fulvivirga maritima]